MWRVLEGLVLIGGGVAVTLAVVALLRTATGGLTRFFNVHELGLLESNIPGLREVIVVAHRVEDPTDTLRRAVRENLAKGVRYVFLVSESKASEEVAGYVLYFFALANKTQYTSEHDFKESKAVQIYKLPYDWDDYPYVFYRYEREVDDGFATFGVRGCELKEGIANSYYALPRAMAQTVARAIMAGAPSELDCDVPKLQSDEFQDAVPRILSLSQRVAS